MVGICGGTGGGKFGGGILGKLGGGIFVGIPGGGIPGTDKPTEPEIEINWCQNKKCNLPGGGIEGGAIVGGASDPDLGSSRQTI